MAFKSTVHEILSNSMLLQLAADSDIKSEEHLKLLFPHLNKNLSSKNKTQKNACIQTTPVVDPAHIPWILYIGSKAEKLCVALNNLLNSIYQHHSDISDGHASADRMFELTSKNGGNEIAESRLKTKFSSKQLVDETSGRWFGSVKQNGIEGSLKEILELAHEIRNSLPVLDYDTQPQNFKLVKKPIIRSLIPERKQPRHKRIDMISKLKPRRSNTMPDLFEGRPHLDKWKKPSFEETVKVPTASGTMGSKSGQYVPPANRPYCLRSCTENKASTHNDVLYSENAIGTGAIPKRQQPVVSTRTRTASQSTNMKRTTSNRPRWK